MPRERSNPLAAAAVVAFLLPLLYVLSVGPAAWLYNAGGLGKSGEETLQACYKPLELLHDRFEWAQVPLDWRLEWWE
jgi:hypothetical protein